MAWIDLDAGRRSLVGSHILLHLIGGNEPLGRHRLITIDLRLGEIACRDILGQRRLRLRQRGLRRSRIDLEQQLPGLHGVAVLDLAFEQLSIDQRFHRYAIDRFDRADRVQGDLASPCA